MCIRDSFTVTPPQAVILAPHTSYRYGNPDGIYMDDWLHFETTDEACTRRLNAMSNRPFPIGNHRLYTFCIQQILWEQSYGDPAAAQENTDALFVLLLNHLNEAFRKQAVRQARNPFQERLQPVSYTHLDVYKRQVPSTVYRRVLPYPIHTRLSSNTFS